MEVVPEGGELQRYFLGQVYIVYMGATPKNKYNAKYEHPSLLQQVLRGSTPQESLVYSYGRSLRGFAARLTDVELAKLEGMNGVVSVFPNTKLQLHTTRSWDFVGFPTTVQRVPQVESNIVIGVIDTGIWLDSDSFNDRGLGPPPSKWNGICQNFTCNNKVIGARFYKADRNFTGEEKSPIDTRGHGTHTASTAAGREVASTSYFGVASGTVRGAVPSARIAVYKVCYEEGCDAADVLAAFDDAIADGVDVISISLGDTSHEEYHTDVIAIGAYHATQKGILVSASAGNEGPNRRTVANSAPWMLTVASSTTDRRITSNVTLGNNITLQGYAINAFPTNTAFSPVVYQGDNCAGNLGKSVVEGKIVVCNQYSYGVGASQAGAQGLVMRGSVPEDGSPLFFLPATLIGSADYGKVALYLNHSSNPTALIHRSDSAFLSAAPYVANFSSRGPSAVTPLILKPDITAPGVDILAAWTPRAHVVGYSDDEHKAKYNFASGTSMACPHVSGAAAYLKTLHPTWSPAAIKSSLMTTVSPMKTVDPLHRDFSYGSGEINLSKAVDPGLVYDTLESDYMVFFCNLGYTTEKIKILTGQSVMMCGSKNGTEAQLNYPSMTEIVNSKQAFNTSFPRRVTNVGSANSVYKATISKPDQLNISVTPDVLSFKSWGEVQSFVVGVRGGPFETNSVMSASVTWSDGVHSVRSPIVVLVEVE